jgi:hypothetical protein
VYYHTMLALSAVTVGGGALMVVPGSLHAAKAISYGW